MLLFQALKQRSIALIWIGQLLSSIGDEIYAVVFIWIAVGFIGTDTGFFTATLSLSLLIVSLFGGKWADHWNPFRTMIRVDCLRGILILVPVALTFFAPLSFPLLWFVSLILAGMAGLFDPAMQIVLPQYCKDQTTLQAANGLMSTTTRMARVIAPLLIGALTAIIPLIHFFTLNALSFFISAFSIFLLRKQPILKHHPSPVVERLGIKAHLTAAIRIIKKDQLMWQAIVTKSIIAGLWRLGYGIGIALLVKERHQGNIQAFGMVMGAYGVGNIVSAVALGNSARINKEGMMYMGYIWLGVGFLGLIAAPNLKLMMIAAAICAIGGPMNDLPYIDLVQMRFKLHDLPRLFRLKLAGETTCTLIMFAASPFLFRWFSVSRVVGFCGLALVLIGIYGKMRETPELANSEQIG